MKKVYIYPTLIFLAFTYSFSLSPSPLIPLVPPSIFYISLILSLSPSFHLFISLSSLFLSTSLPISIYHYLALPLSLSLSFCLSCPFSTSFFSFSLLILLNFLLHNWLSYMQFKQMHIKSVHLFSQRAY